MNDKFENFNMINVKFHKEGLKIFLNISLLYWKFRHSLPFKLWLVLGVLFDRIIVKFDLIQGEKQDVYIADFWEMRNLWKHLFLQFSYLET